MVRAPDAADWALARGHSAFTRPELAQLLGIPEDQVRRRLHVPSRRGERVMPVRGLWVPVPSLTFSVLPMPVSGQRTSRRVLWLRMWARRLIVASTSGSSTT